eukprot:TRINITY_DN13872_c0_g1_i1.p1 TRINITY_DN13872_c0_g1~~TRINITY_DN13872_c0_g1_i1.p1  ORF type:complete len:297 (+),score=93.65 TRINITY_DN13872_c0_g1_i1:85-891(+)
MALTVTSPGGRVAREGGFVTNTAVLDTEGCAGVGAEVQRTSDGALGWMFDSCPCDPENAYKYRQQDIDGCDRAFVDELQGIPAGHYINGRGARKPEKAALEIANRQMMFELQTRGSQPAAAPTPSETRKQRLAAFRMFETVQGHHGWVAAFDLPAALLSAGAGQWEEDDLAGVRAGLGIERAGRVSFEQFEHICDLLGQAPPPTADEDEGEAAPGSPHYAAGGGEPYRPRGEPKDKPPPRKCKEWLEGQVEVPRKVRSQFYFKGPGEV